jgi:hypothetical protein
MEFASAVFETILFPLNLPYSYCIFKRYCMLLTLSWGLVSVTRQKKGEGGKSGKEDICLQWLSYALHIHLFLSFYLSCELSVLSGSLQRKKKLILRYIILSNLSKET